MKQRLLSCCRADSGDCGVGCMAMSRVQAGRSVALMSLALGPYRVGRVKAGWTILAGGFLFSVSSLPGPLACAAQPNPRYSVGM